MNYFIVFLLLVYMASFSRPISSETLSGVPDAFFAAFDVNLEQLRGNDFNASQGYRWNAITPKRFVCWLRAQPSELFCIPPRTFTPPRASGTGNVWPFLIPCCTPDGDAASPVAEKKEKSLRC